MEIVNLLTSHKWLTTTFSRPNTRLRINFAWPDPSKATSPVSAAHLMSDTGLGVGAALWVLSSSHGCHTDKEPHDIFTLKRRSQSCWWCTVTHWNLTWVPLLSNMFSVSVWCSAEVKAFTDAVPWVTYAALNKYHSSSLGSTKTSLHSVLIPRCAIGQSNTHSGGPAGNVWRIPPAISCVCVCVGGRHSLRSHSSEPLWWSGR